MDALFFYLFAALVLGGAIFTITRRSAVHSAISLIVSLMGVAGLYLLQQAEFLFASLQLSENVTMIRTENLRKEIQLLRGQAHCFKEILRVKIGEQHTPSPV